MILRYVAGYVPKFSDSFQTTWLNDEASDYAVARRILSEYHPLEPEMWLQLGAHEFGQCFSSGKRRPFLVPIPWLKEMPLPVQSYMASEWRADNMPLLEFLRKASDKGVVQKHIRKAWQATGSHGTLGDFANAFRMSAATPRPALGDISLITHEGRPMSVRWRSVDAFNAREITL